MTRLAVYPGSFDPPTVAHLAIVEAALAHVDRVTLVLSEQPLGKPVAAGGTSVEQRRRVLEVAAHGLTAVDVTVTPARLVVEVAEEAGADAVVLGTDKWAQVLDPAWYGGSVEARDAALGRLPVVLLARRAPTSGAPGRPSSPSVPSTPSGRSVPSVPASLVDIIELELPASLRHVSSTRARAGEPELMVDAARSSGHWA